MTRTRYVFVVGVLLGADLLILADVTFTNLLIVSTATFGPPGLARLSRRVVGT